MQPYLFPYIGYFQLINWADTFVFYNDAQFIKGGWINRNNILISNQKHLFNFSLEKSSTFSKINERKFDAKKFEFEKKKFLKTIYLSYSKAPFFNNIYALLESTLNLFTNNLSQSIFISHKNICDYIQINTTFILSENLHYNRNESAEKKVIAMCKELHGKHYTNPIGGVNLYSKEVFNRENLELSFLKTKPIEYKQFNNNFIPWLSIIDILMFNSIEEIKIMLEQYELSQ